MEDKHRALLRRNYSMLVREMSPELVGEKLYSKCIFTLKMKEVVLTQLTIFAKSRKILRFSTETWQTAFHSFCCALEETNQSELALKLRQEDYANLKEPAKNPKSSNSRNKQKTLKKYTQLCQLHLGGEVYVTGNLFENDNVVRIHIRQYGGENQKPYPTKKGVTMSLAEWVTLECLLNGMEAALENYSEQDSEASWNLGGNIYITASKEYPLLDFRHYCKPYANGEFKSTTNGVKFNLAKLQNLKDVTLIIRNYIPQLMYQDCVEYPIIPREIDLQSLEGLLEIPE